MGSENDEVGVVAVGTFHDGVAHWSFLDDPMHRLILNEWIWCEILQLVFRPDPRLGNSISKIALPDTKPDRVRELDHIQQKQFAADELLQLKGIIHDPLGVWGAIRRYKDL